MTPTEPDRRRAEARSEPLRALLIGTYEMGRQPFGLASPAAWLRDAGVDVTCVDLTRERLSNDVVSRAGLVAWYLPMHTATRLALPIIQRVRDSEREKIHDAYKDRVGELIQQLVHHAGHLQAAPQVVEAGRTDGEMVLAILLADADAVRERLRRAMAAAFDEEATVAPG